MKTALKNRADSEKLQAVQGKIDNLIQLMAETGSKNVVVMLVSLNKSKSSWKLNWQKQRRN